MAVTVRIPTQLRPLAGGNATVSVEGGSVGDVLKQLEDAHPGFADRLFDESGKLRRFVNVFVAEEDIRFLGGESCCLKEGDRVLLVPSIAGG